jgi:uncharacterized protein (TIGR01777 family)
VDVLISGASGLIGSALADSLKADGHSVRRLGRGAGAEVRWDPMGGEIEADKLAGIDAVVHLAGAGIGDKRWSDNQRRILVESRTKGTRLLAETAAALDPRPAVFVSGSGINFYGGGDAAVTENDAAGEGFLPPLCVAWEAATQPAADAGIRVACIRSGIVLDAKRGALTKLLTPFKLGVGGKMGSGRQWWSWISIDDEVGAIRWLLDHDIEGPVNLTAPEAVTNAEFSKILGRVLGRPSLIPVPAFALKLALGRQMAEELLLLSQHVQPAVLESHGYKFKHRDLETAQRAILKK